MHANIYDFLELDAEELVESTFVHLKKANAEHYRSSDQETLRSRCERLVHAFLESLRDGPERFAAYMRVIGPRRISQGFMLQEIQMALSIFEQEVWKRCASEIPERADLLKVLSMVSWTVGNAKDELARIYIEEKTAAEKLLDEMKEKITAYQAGRKGE